MKALPAPREGLNLLATQERAGRPTWLAAVPALEAASNRRPAAGPRPARGTGAGAPRPKELPYWMKAAIELGTRFYRVAAAATRPRPPTSSPAISVTVPPGRRKNAAWSAVSGAAGSTTSASTSTTSGCSPVAASIRSPRTTITIPSRSSRRTGTHPRTIRACWHGRRTPSSGSRGAACTTAS